MWIQTIRYDLHLGSHSLQSMQNEEQMLGIYNTKVNKAGRPSDCQNWH